MARSLIIDVGLHKGDDTDFYLRKGFDVLAVEADPKHVEHCRQQFPGPIEEGRLTIVHAAIAPHCETVKFYVNLDKDDWSSTEAVFGTRSNTRYETIEVPAITFAALVGQHVAGRHVHYIKCDIEGGDIHVLRDLVGMPLRPRYFSVEAHHVGYLSYMWVMGYKRFKLVNQNLLWAHKLPNPAREGEYVDYSFASRDTSGPFGEEAPGQWLDFEVVMDAYLALMRTAIRIPEISVAWYDFHGRLDD